MAYSAGPSHSDPALDTAKTQALISAGQFFHQRGWVPATGGNFSYRLDSKRLAVTASGWHKGELKSESLMVVDLQGQAEEPQRKSSAETLLHCQVYRRMPQVGCVLHTHSVASTILSRRLNMVRLDQYELLKILEGVKTHEISVDVPVFGNDQDIARLAREVDQAMDRGQAQHAYLIRGHGLYTWGPTVDVARHRVEALEFLFECELRGGAA